MRAGNIASVLRKLVTANENWKWVSSIIRLVYFTDFHCVVDQVVLETDQQFKLMTRHELREIETKVEE